MDRPEVLVVGGGPAGLGVAVALQHVGVRPLVLEARRVGASFLRWPRETRLLTPSFTANGFGLADLNAIAPGTSPAYSLGEEHPTGRDYALYLEAVAHHFGVALLRARVRRVAHEAGVFRLFTSRGVWEAPFLVWAVGEYSFPRFPFPGASLALPYPRIGSFAQLAREAPRRVIIGGYESGMDTALHLAQRGVEAVVLDPEAPWERRVGEPSRDLSPYTLDRLRATPGRIRLRKERVLALRQWGEGFEILTSRGKTLRTPYRPVLAAGFGDGLDPVRSLFSWHEGRPLLTLEDESTLVPGLFLAGPKVSHGGAPFCFIYKFRARFPIVARAIARRLGRDEGPLEAYQREGIWMEDPTCCEVACAC
ncbi:MAG: NAD(P)/FAD-dependent oxidoreductase [Thermus sp.]|uniref:NAD(P)/FAD-dependent oxidoreductase n=1 Tax=Thermus sp. TaxID=275 RepID=UPI00391DFA08